MRWYEREEYDPRCTYLCHICGKTLGEETGSYSLIIGDDLDDWIEEEIVAKFGVADPWADFGELCMDCLEEFDPDYQFWYP